jgi:hypothetical protein
MYSFFVDFMIGNYRRALAALRALVLGVAVLVALCGGLRPASAEPQPPQEAPRYRVIPLPAVEHEGLEPSGEGLSVAVLDGDLSLVTWSMREDDGDLAVYAQWLHVPSGQWLDEPRRILNHAVRVQLITERDVPAVAIGFESDQRSGWLHLEPLPQGAASASEHTLPKVGGVSAQDIRLLALPSGTLLFSYNEDLNLEVRRVSGGVTVQGERIFEVTVPGEAWIGSFQVMSCAANLWLAYPTQDDFIVHRGLSWSQGWASVGVTSARGHQLLCLNDRPYIAALRDDGRADTPYLLDLSGGHALPADALAWQPVALTQPIADGASDLGLLAPPATRDALPVLVTSQAEDTPARLYVLTFPAEPLTPDALPVSAPALVGELSEVKSADPQGDVTCAMLPSGEPICVVGQALIPVGDIWFMEGEPQPPRVGPAVLLPERAPGLGASAGQVEAARQMLGAVAVQRPYSEEWSPVQSWACGPSLPYEGPNSDDQDLLYGSACGDWLSCESDLWLALSDAVDARCAPDLADPGRARDPHCAWLQLHLSCLRLLDERDVMRAHADESPWIYEDFEERPCAIMQAQAQSAAALTYFVARWRGGLNVDESTALTPPYWLRLSFTKAAAGWVLDDVAALPPVTAPSLEHTALSVGLPQLCAQALTEAHRRVCAAAVTDFKEARIAPLSAYGVRYARELRYCQCDEVLGEGYLMSWRRAYGRWWLQAVEPSSCSERRCY